jgi:hypothetical protein
MVISRQIQWDAASFVFSCQKRQVPCNFLMGKETIDDQNDIK